jgi:GAF domain-containing protein
VLMPLRDRVCAEQTFESAVARVLADAVALQGAEFGDVQLPADGVLLIVEQIGFKPPYLQAFKEVRPTDGCACGRALRTRKPLVIPDIRADEDYSPFLKIAKAAGYRAVQTTPLFTDAGVLVGFVSTHFANVHTPTKIEMEILSAYSHIAGDRLYELLGGEDLGAKARSLHRALYERLGLR